MSTIAYVIAGSEATGGAGLQADLKTFERLGVYGVGTITCIVSFDPKPVPGGCRLRLGSGDDLPGPAADKGV